MPDRAQILKTIDDAYAARATGDKAAVRTFLAPGASFRLAGDPAMLPKVRSALEGLDAAGAIDALIDAFTFHRQERLNAVVDGNKAAVHWRVTLSSAGGEKVTTELYDLWTIDEAGKLTSLTQFADTALIAALTA